MAITLINRSGEMVSVPENQVRDAVLSGQYALDASQQYSVTYNGQSIDMDAERLTRNIVANTDFEIESPEAKQQRLDQEQYGGTAGAVGAFAEGVARDLTLGGYDLAARGIDAAIGTDITEGIAGRKRANPTAATVGELAGMAGSIAYSGGIGVGKKAAQVGVKAAAKAGERSLLRGAAEVLGTGVRYSPSGMTNALGRATEEAAQNLIGKGIVGKAAGMGAAGAIEGGLYTAGYAASEAALNDADPHEIGEAAISGLWSGATTGAILGGLLGAGTGVVGKGAAALGAKYGDSLQTMAGRRFFKSLGGQQSELTALISRAGGETEDQLLRRLADDVGGFEVTYTNKKGQQVSRQILRPGTTARDVLEDIDRGRQQVGAKLGETIETVSNYIEKNAPSLRPDMQGFYQLLQERAAKIQSLGITSANREFATASKNFDKMYAHLNTPGVNVTLNDLWEFRKSLDKSSLMKQRSGLTIADPAKEELMELRNAWEKEIQKAVDNVIENIPDLKDKMGKSYSQLKRQYMSFANASELAEKGSARLTGNRMFSLTDNIWGAAQAAGGIASGNSGKVLAGMGVGGASSSLLSDLSGQDIDPTTSALLGGATMIGSRAIRTRGSSTAAALLMGISKRNASITKGINSLLTGARQATVKLTGKQIAKEETKKILGGKESDDLHTSYQRYQKNLNLESLQAQELMNRAGDDPVSQSVASAAIRKTDYLTQVMPTGIRDPAQPWNQKWQPNPTEVIRYSRKVEIANNPQRVFSLAKEGALTPDHMEALASVYPVYYEEIQNKGREALADSRINLTYRQRQQIGMLLNLEDATYDLSNVNRMQSAFDKPEPQQKQPINLPQEIGTRDKTPFNA